MVCQGRNGEEVAGQQESEQDNRACNPLASVSLSPTIWGGQSEAGGRLCAGEKRGNSVLPE